MAGCALECSKACGDRPMVQRKIGLNEFAPVAFALRQTTSSPAPVTPAHAGWVREFNTIVREPIRGMDKLAL